MMLEPVHVDINPDEAGVFDLVFEHKHDNAGTKGGMDTLTWAELANAVKVWVPSREDYQLVGYKYHRDGGVRSIRITGYKPESHDPVVWDVILNEKE